MKILTVDPGNNTGWALFDIEDYIPKQVDYFSLSAIALKTWSVEQQLVNMWNKFMIVLNATEPDRVIIEGTRVYSGSQKSMVSAVRGNLINLTMLLGGYASCCHARGIHFQILTASKWKGQMSKEATAAQVKHITGVTFLNEHITDAVGIGLSVMKLLPIGRAK